MRFLGLIVCLLALAEISTAQDTNFSSGPQYLPISGSSMFLRPIATPSLSLDAPLPSVPVGSTEATTTTPSDTSQGQADLRSIYWGTPQTIVVEISYEPVRTLPASITDVGVTGITDVPSLIGRGFGVTLGETASFWKSHKAHAPRLYTNRDIDRLHGS